MSNIHAAIKWAFAGLIFCTACDIRYTGYLRSHHMKHEAYFSDEFQCRKCGHLCWIDADGVRTYAWCHECDDYAEGFEGASWHHERMSDAPGQEDR